MASRPLLLALAALAASACATTGKNARGEGDDRHVVFKDPLVITANPEAEKEFLDKNDSELFAIGTSAFSAGEFRRSATAFSRLCDFFPKSPHYPAALYNAGMAWERVAAVENKEDAWRLALERFKQLVAEYTGPDADDGAFRIAECHWHLKDFPSAHSVLSALAAREDLGTTERIQALTQLGVVQLDEGDAAGAEKTLRLALLRYNEAVLKERLDDYFPAQAQFYLGEVYRAHFQAIKLDPSQNGEKKLQEDLEYKAEMLLSAQGHYLRAIRIGNANWAIASGYRIGELYDELYTHMTEAPLPPNLDEEQRKVYQDELHRKVRVLVTKAIALYERTLATAQRVGVDNNKFVEKTAESLERMKKILLADAGTIPPLEAEAGTLPADADPERPDPKDSAAPTPAASPAPAPAPAPAEKSKRGKSGKKRPASKSKSTK